MHEGSTQMKTDFSGSLFINLAPSGLNDIRTESRDYANGFTVIDFNKQHRFIKCIYWRYNHLQKEFSLGDYFVCSDIFYALACKQSSSWQIDFFFKQKHTHKKKTISIKERHV